MKQAFGVLALSVVLLTAIVLAVAHTPDAEAARGGAHYDVADTGMPLSGGVMTGDIDMNGNDIILDADGDSLLDLGIDDNPWISVGAATAYQFGIAGLVIGNGASLVFGVNGRIYNSSAALDLGTQSGTGHGLGTGDITVGADIEFNGDSWFDGPAILNAVTADPCGNFPEGSIFYNDTSDYMCFCDGAGVDFQVHAPTTACF